MGASYPGRTAGPAFDIARPAIFLLPHQHAAWKIIKERLDALQQACASLGQRAGLGALAPLAGKLQSMSQDIGKYGANTGGDGSVRGKCNEQATGSGRGKGPPELGAGGGDGAC